MTLNAKFIPTAAALAFVISITGGETFGAAIAFTLMVSVFFGFTGWVNR